MEQSPSWEADGFSASQEISRILRYPKVYYPIHNGPPLVSFLSQTDPLHVLTLHILKIHLNVILQVSVPIRGTCMYVAWLWKFLRRGVVSTSPNTQAGGSPRLRCPRLLIQDIRMPFLRPHLEDALCRCDRDPLPGKRTYLMSTMKTRVSTTGSGNFSLLQTMQLGCGIQPAPNLRGTVSCFPKAKRTVPVAATCT